MRILLEMHANIQDGWMQFWLEYDTSELSVDLLCVIIKTKLFQWQIFFFTLNVTTTLAAYKVLRM